jgi:hypothetical protein
MKTMTMKKGRRTPDETTTKLIDLSVERVDGVDRPATGRRFFLFKSAQQSADRVRELAGTVRKSTASFSNVIFGGDPVLKAAGATIREWVPGAGGLSEATPDAVANKLTEMVHQPTNVYQEQSYDRSTSGFDREGPSHGLVRGGDAYAVVDPWLAGDPSADPGFGPEADADLPPQVSHSVTKGQLLRMREDAKATNDVDLGKAIVKKLKSAGVDPAKIPDVVWPYGATVKLRRN